MKKGKKEKKEKNKKIVFFIVLILLLLSLGVAYYFCQKYVHYFILFFPVLITVLVVWAMFEAEPSEEETYDDISITSYMKEVIKLSYEKAIDMHTQTDRGMFQIISIFVPASLVVLGWVLSKKSGYKLSSEATLIVGSIAIVLVGVATLIKHRLRYYNKIRENYMRNLERVLFKEDSEIKKFGIHNYFKENCSTHFLLSFHIVVDIYYFVYLIIWVLLFITNTDLIRYLKFG